MKIINFIKNNKNNWRQELTSDPYNLNIKENKNLIKFNYDQIESDMNKQIVQKSRGLILEKGTWKVVCYPFDKFFNYFNDEQRDELDRDNIKVEEKIDGSLICLYYYNGQWNVCTMGTLNAKNAPLQESNKYDNFYELYKAAENEKDIIYSDLNRRYTYMFELVSPENRIVVPHKETKLYHTGTRDNITRKELDVDIGIQKPKTYDFNKIEDIVEASKELPYSDEGYVVVDENYNRVKVKSISYVNVHNLVSKLCPKNILKIIRNDNHDDFLAKFPEYKDKFKPILNVYKEFLDNVRNDLYDAKGKMGNVDTRKEFALWAKEQTYPAILFDLYDDKFEIENYRDQLREKIHIKKLLDMIDV